MLYCLTPVLAAALTFQQQQTCSAHIVHNSAPCNRKYWSIQHPSAGQQQVRVRVCMCVCARPRMRVRAC